MTFGSRTFDREHEVMLEHARVIRPLPDAVRARALARARATLLTGAEPAPAPAMPVLRHGRRLALAAALTLLVGAAGAVAAIPTGFLDRFQTALTPASRPGTPARIAFPAPQPSRAVVEATSIPRSPEKQRRGRRPSAQESYAAELSLLRRAHVAYASRDFPSALVLVTEHTREFPNGHLAEEREALRIKSLAGSGRARDARRTVAAFAARFPRSVLLRRLQETAGAME